MLERLRSAISTKEADVRCLLLALFDLVHRKPLRIAGRSWSNCGHQEQPDNTVSAAFSSCSLTEMRVGYAARAGVVQGRR